jgi:hypothetical protein
LLGILGIILGLKSCRKDAIYNGKQCHGEEFTCTYRYNDGSTYSYRYCEDGWNAYYADAKLNDVFYNADYTIYWNDYVDNWANKEQWNSYLNCTF